MQDLTFHSSLSKFLLGLRRHATTIISDWQIELWSKVWLFTKSQTHHVYFRMEASLLHHNFRISSALHEKCYTNIITHWKFIIFLRLYKPTKTCFYLVKLNHTICELLRSVIHSQHKDLSNRIEDIRLFCHIL